MSKKNSSVNLKNGFSDFEDLSYIFLNFKSKLDQLNKSSYILINYNNYIGENEIINNIIIKYSDIKLAGGEGLFTHKDK